MKKISIFIILTIILGIIVFAPAFAQEKMTLEEYQALLKQWQDREANALTAIAIEDSIISDLKERYKLTDAEIAQIQQEIYEMLGVYEADVVNYNKELATLENQIRTLRALTPELLYQRQDEIETAEENLNSLKRQSLANVPDNWNKLESLTTSLENLKQRVPKPRHDTYIVVRGDYLWKISGKAEIYNDPYKWPRIWSANAESIKDPNLIHPNQNLTIIRQLDKNQHMVAKGESLREIAARPEVYADPFAWTQIYEANKNQIEDPNLIYPEQILTLPGK